MRTRRSARRLALDVLYEAEIRDRLPMEALTSRRAEGWVTGSPDDAGRAEEPAAEQPGPAEPAPEEPAPEVLAYARSLVEGVQAHQPDIDALLASYSDRWTLRRMPVIDRNLLRIGVYELLWGADIPVAVAINEAVELAKSLSTDDSGRFVNGLLGRIAADRRPDRGAP